VAAIFFEGDITLMCDAGTPIRFKEASIVDNKDSFVVLVLPTDVQCTDVDAGENLLRRYVDGELDAAVAHRLEQHATGCLACSVALLNARTLESAARQLNVYGPRLLEHVLVVEFADDCARRLR
jgi:hypothetical protein